MHPKFRNLLFKSLEPLIPNSIHNSSRALRYLSSGPSKKPIKDPARFVKKKFQHINNAPLTPPKKSLSFNIHPLAVMGVITILYSLYGLFQSQQRVGEIIGQSNEIINEARQQFLDRNLKVLFVMGGPSAGKTELSLELAKTLNYQYLSLSELLSLELHRRYSPHRDTINSCLKEGKDLPAQVSVDVLRDAIVASNKSGVIIDGFPRKLDQAIKFQDTVLLPTAVVVLSCPLEEMVNRFHRVSNQSKDDAFTTIHNRNQASKNSMDRTAAYYQRHDKVIYLSCMTPTPDLIESTLEFLQPSSPPNSSQKN